MQPISLKFGGNVQDHDLNRNYKIQFAMGNRSIPHSGFLLQGAIFAKFANIFGFAKNFCCARDTKYRNLIRNSKAFANI